LVCLGAFTIIILIVMTLNFNVFSIVCVQTRAWNLVFAAATIPALFAVQLSFPVILSYRNEKVQKKAELPNKHHHQARISVQVREEMLHNIQEFFSTKECGRKYSRLLRIRNLFVLPSSPHSVNISYKIRLEILNSLHPFDKENRVSKLMSQESTASSNNSSMFSFPLIDTRSYSVELLPNVFESALGEIIKLLTKDTFLVSSFQRPTSPSQKRRLNSTNQFPKHDFHFA
jgi:hypothetical protein